MPRQRWEFLRRTDVSTELQDAFKLLRQELSDLIFLKLEGDIFTHVSTGATTQQIPHRLGFIPTDMWVTYCDAMPSLPAIQYHLSDTENISVTFAGAGKARFFIGRHEED